MSTKPRLTDTEKKALLRVFVDRFGLVPLVTIALRAIGAQKVGLLLQFKDPDLTDEDEERLLAGFAQITTTKEVISLAVKAIGLPRVNEFLDYLRSRDEGIDPAVPFPPTSPGLTPWRDRLKRPLLLVSAPDYWWVDMTEAERAKYLGAIYATGNVDGIDVELAGKTGAENYIKGINPTRDYAKEYAVAFDQFEPLISDVRARDLICSLKFWNANGNSQGRPASWWKELAKSFVKRFGSDNLIVLPVNERDTATPDGTRKAIYQGFVEAGFPAAQLIGYDNANEYGIQCGFTETHPQKSDCSDLKGSSKNHINCTDSRPSISYCYSDWLKLDGIGGTPKLANIESVVSRCDEKGTSCTVYSFRQKPDYEALAAASKAWRRRFDPVPVPGGASGADAIDISGFVGLGPHKGVKPQNIKITRLIKSAKLTSTTLSFEHDNLRWPTNSPVGQNIDGRVFIFWMENGKLTGGHYDWRRPDTRTRDFKNIRDGYLDEKRPPVGATIWICFVNDWINGPAERTNVIECAGRWI